MSKVLRFAFLATVAACVLVQPLAAAETVTGNLVTAGWLHDNLNNPEIVILDSSPTPVYMAGHIPGAVNADMMMYGAEERPAEEMQGKYRSWGISPGKKVVLYDKGGDMMATRMLFSLYYDGFPADHLFILDGGMAKWQENGLPVTKESTAAKKGSFKVNLSNREAKAELPEVLTATGDPANNVVLEALGGDWHFGQVQMFDRAGHLPNSTLLPSADLYNPDKTFKSPDELRRMLTYLGIRPEQRIYTYCGGGVAASVPFFVLKFMLHYPQVKLYTDSEIGWLADDRRLPYWTYDAPYLMRDTGWLQFWAGKMIRMYRGAPVSIIDVRPAEAFNQGHVPFAVNIPAEAFQTNAGNPAKLAEILGPVGVDPGHEAVIVSGAGLTRDSALAFLLLHALGQRKVSLFMDSMDRWAQLNRPLSKEATAVGPKKAPYDVSIPPVAYAAKARGGVLIADAKETHGLYPKVLIASGKDLPSKPQPGTVVHVPYTELLNADGTPKPAKEVWNILGKAGVPRYAELVCISDNPGESAANYFMLKLMGYPDVKVLLQ